MCVRPSNQAPVPIALAVKDAFNVFIGSPPGQEMPVRYVIIPVSTEMWFRRSVFASFSGNNSMY